MAVQHGQLQQVEHLSWGGQSPCLQSGWEPGDPGRKGQVLPGGEERGSGHGMGTGWVRKGAGSEGIFTDSQGP